MISVITLTYNKAHLIEALANSLEEQCGAKDWEWVVVDNGTDDTLEVLKKFKGRIQVRYLKHDNSGNFSNMNNMAVFQKAQGDVLLFLNNDTVANSNILQSRALLDLYKEVGAVGGVLRYPSGRLQHAGVFIAPSVTPGNIGHGAVEIFGMTQELVNPEKLLSPYVCQAVTGAALMVRTNDFYRIGGFHDNFVWCFEDVDLCFRVSHWLGKQCVVDPYMKLTHFESESGGNREVSLNLNTLRGTWGGRIRSDLKVFQSSELFRSREFILDKEPTP